VAAKASVITAKILCDNSTQNEGRTKIISNAIKSKSIRVYILEKMKIIIPEMFMKIIRGI
jgi:hypothetical protein